MAGKEVYEDKRIKLVALCLLKARCVALSEEKSTGTGRTAKRRYVSATEQTPLPEDKILNKSNGL
jgi:hypothetical protein